MNCKPIFFLLALPLLFSFSDGKDAESAETQVCMAVKKYEKKNLSWVMNDVFVAKTEVSNVEYREFLYHMKDKVSEEEYLRLYPDTAVWNRELAYGEPLKDYYFWHPAYHEYPVVGINHYQATAFCDWLTEVYMCNPKRTYSKVQFRLPTEAEWQMAFTGGDTNSIYPWGGPYLRNVKGQYLCNFHTVSEACIRQNPDGEMIVDCPDNAYTLSFVNDMTFFTASVYSYPPNEFGVYNLAGNVAELLAEPGQHRGGSWNTTGYYLQVNAEDPYAGDETPRADVGFRFYMEILEY